MNNILAIIVVLVTVAGAIEATESGPYEKYLQEQQTIESGVVFGCFLVLLFMAAVIVTPIILCVVVLTMCLTKRRTAP